MARFRVSEIFLGSALTIAVFAIGMLFARTPIAYPVEPSVQMGTIKERADTKPFEDGLTGATWLTKDAAGFFAFLAALIGLGQAVLFYTQLRLMRAGMDDATAAAAAAKASAEATITIAGSSRAWMVYDTLIHGAFRDATVEGVPHKTGLMFHVGWENAGSSPAIRLQGYSTGVVVAIDSPPPPFAADWGSSPAVHMPLGQGRKMSTVAFPLFDENLERFRNREAKLFIYSVLEYFDIYSPAAKRISEVCVEIIFDGYAVDARGGNIPHLQIRPAGPQNLAT